MPSQGIHDRAPIVITGDAVNRFWEKVDKSGECWNWTAAKRSTGYGCIKVAGRLISSHRFSYVLHFGDVPQGKIVCHNCDNRLCVRPDHLFAGSPLDNVRDMDSKGRCDRVCGERSTNAKLTDDKVQEILFLRQFGLTYKEISACVEVSHRSVEKVLCGHSWKHITGGIKFPSAF